MPCWLRDRCVRTSTEFRPDPGFRTSLHVSGGATSACGRQSAPKIALSDIVNLLRRNEWRLDCRSTDSTECFGLVERTLDDHGRIDVIVNNAAVLHQGPIENSSENGFRKLIEVNTFGPFLGIRSVVPAIREQRGASIVHEASIASFAP